MRIMSGIFILTALILISGCVPLTGITKVDKGEYRITTFLTHGLFNPEHGGSMDCKSQPNGDLHCGRSY